MNHDLTTHAGQIANIKAVRARIAAAAYRPKPVQTNEVTVVRHVKKSEYWDLPTWKTQRTYFNDHVNRWRMRSMQPNTDWLKDRCDYLGVSYDAIISHSRNRELVKVRHQLMYEINVKFPELSLPQIGKMLGSRDHTTILHGIRVYKERIKCE